MTLELPVSVYPARLEVETQEHSQLSVLLRVFLVLASAAVVAVPRG